jgi:hypothetical protein
MQDNGCQPSRLTSGCLQTASGSYGKLQGDQSAPASCEAFQRRSPAASLSVGRKTDNSLSASFIPILPAGTGGVKNSGFSRQRESAAGREFPKRQ